MNLLLYGSDEKELLSYLTRGTSVVCGIPLKNNKPQIVSVEAIVSLDFNEALTFAIYNKDLGNLVNIQDGQKVKLPFKTELLSHKPYINQNLDKDVIDFYVSPVILYKRSYLINSVLSEAELLCPAKENSEKIKKWYNRIISWCRKKGQSFFSWSRNDFPMNFYSPLTVNTRYAFPEALNGLKQDKLFSARDISEKQVEQWLEDRNK